MRRSRCRAKGGVGGGYTPPIQRCFARLATQGRGGSRGLRPFRRGRWGEEQQAQDKPSSRRRQPYGLTFLHVPALWAIWSYVCACLSAGGGSQAIWAYVFFLHVSALVVIRTYVYACPSAGGDMDLRFCMPQRRRSYGLTPVHV